MKIVPYKAENTLRQVALVETDEGVDLVFVDVNGDREDSILTLSAGGIDLYEEVSEGYGLPLDGKGCVKVVGTPELPDDCKALRKIIERMNRAIVDDENYDDTDTLDNVTYGDRQEVTVGQLRTIVKALEKRL